MNTAVTENTQLHDTLKAIVADLTQIRKDAGFSQEATAGWLKVSRKKLSEFENGDIDFKLLVAYCDLFSVELNLNYKIY
jgi:DNA-binding XRE family transcriptional regulator